MNTSADLLIELGTEELPPKALSTLSQHFTREVLAGLAEAGLQHGDCAPFATPRRLAMVIKNLPFSQPDQQIERRGPALSAAFDKQGAPTGAALGFARSCGVAFENLERLETDKGAWLVFRTEARGQATAALLPEILQRALAALPIPKRMRWGSADHEFVRPVHWLVLLHGHSVVPASIYGVESGDTTWGHRFMSAEAIRVTAPADYAGQLMAEGKVIADFASRRSRVETLVREAGTHAGGLPLLDPALLDEVTALVEWPCAIVGNERVIRPRLSDAAFFWNKDRAQRLDTRLARLADMVFERRLGTLLEKSERIAALAAALAAAFAADDSVAARSGLLSRCDLVSEMVGEFPELQGIMGAYYARLDGEPAGVAEALGEFYQPRFAGDAIPATAAGRSAALADKLDTLTGIFGVGGAPTGDKDPYALRRAALGCLRICIESDAAIDLPAALKQACAGHGARIGDHTAGQVFDFMLERARGYFTERGCRPDVIESVLVTRPAQPRELARRIAAVEAFRLLPEAIALAAANKRIGNILRKASDFTPDKVDLSALLEPAELALAQELAEASQQTTAFAAAGEYQAYLGRLARLQPAINAFFDQVMVMAEDLPLRNARLQLLHQLQALFLRVADIGLIAS